MSLTSKTYFPQFLDILDFQGFLDLHKFPDFLDFQHFQGFLGIWDFQDLFPGIHRHFGLPAIPRLLGLPGLPAIFWYPRLPEFTSRNLYTSMTCSTYFQEFLDVCDLQDLLSGIPRCPLISQNWLYTQNSAQFKSLKGPCCQWDNALSIPTDLFLFKA